MDQVDKTAFLRLSNERLIGVDHGIHLSPITMGCAEKIEEQITKDVFLFCEEHSQ